MSSLIQYYEKQKYVGFSGRGCVLGRLFLSLRFAPSLPSPWALFWS